MLLEKFIYKINKKGRSENTLKTFDYSIILCEKFIKKPLEDATFEEIDKFLDYIKIKGFKLEDKNHEIPADRKIPLSDGSIRLTQNKLIEFYNFCFDDTDDTKYHKIVKNIKNIKLDEPKSDIRPQDILLPEDIKKLINISTLERDRCLVAVLFESGIRLGELRALTHDMVEMNEQNQEITFHIPNIIGKTKTGARSVLCLEVFGYVQDWMKCNSDNTHFMPLSEAGIQKILDRLFKRAGINKPSNPHMFRHSSITNAVIMKMQQNQISMRYWGNYDSRMLKIYLHLSEQMINSGYRDAKGMGNSNGNTIINPLSVRCVNCGKLIQSGSLCKTCQDSKKLLEENQLLKSKMEQSDEKVQNLENLVKTQMEQMTKIVANIGAYEIGKEILKHEKKGK